MRMMKGDMKTKEIRKAKVGRCNARPKPAKWPPAHLALPDTLEGIERGRIEQRELFGRDDSREGVLARLTGGRGVDSF